MKTTQVLILSLILGIHTAAFAGNWERVSTDTISFTGDAKSGEAERFKAYE